MAAATVGGGIFNALAFAGASWLFSNFNHNDYEKEQHRHDLAEEKLQKDQQLWEREETRLKDDMEKKRIESEEATDDLGSGVKALDQYYKLTHQHEEHLKEKPKLDYTPSPEFQKYITGVKVVMIGGIVYVGTKLVF